MMENKRYNFACVLFSLPSAYFSIETSVRAGWYIFKFGWGDQTHIDINLNLTLAFLVYMVAVIYGIDRYRPLVTSKLAQWLFRINVALLILFWVGLFTGVYKVIIRGVG